MTVDRSRSDAIAASSSSEGPSGKERVALEGTFCFLPANHPECLNTALVVFFLEAVEGLALLRAQCESRALPATSNAAHLTLADTPETLHLLTEPWCLCSLLLPETASSWVENHNSAFFSRSTHANRGRLLSSVGLQRGASFSYHNGDMLDSGEKGGFGVRHWVILGTLRETLARWAPNADNYTSEPMEVILKAKATHTHTHRYTH